MGGSPCNCRRPAATCPILVLLNVKIPVRSGFNFLIAHRILALANQEAAVIRLRTSLHKQAMHWLEQLPIGGLLGKRLTCETISQILWTHCQRELPAN